MGVSVMEQTRVPIGERSFEGRWEFPRGHTPPFPLAVVLPDRPDRDLSGALPSRPRVRPFLELAHAAVFRKLALFRCKPLEGSGFGPSITAAWGHACRHPQVSKQRIGMIILGAQGWLQAARRMASLRESCEPLAAVIVAPDPDPDLSSLDGVPTRIIRHEDLTDDLQRRDDWIAGRAITHPGVLSDVTEAMADLLRPRWERVARPPGTAIGESMEV